MNSATGRRISFGGSGIVDTAINVMAAPYADSPASIHRPTAGTAVQRNARLTQRNGMPGAAWRGPYDQPPSQ